VKRFVSTFAIAGLSTLLCGCAHQRALVKIEPERYQLTVVPSSMPYSLDGAGDALMLQTRKEHNGVTSYIYRAARVGNHTIVATPARPGPGGCISCVTVRNFVRSNNATAVNAPGLPLPRYRNQPPARSDHFRDHSCPPLVSSELIDVRASSTGEEKGEMGRRSHLPHALISL
jgi:hypothetical protein